MASCSSTKGHPTSHALFLLGNARTRRVEAFTNLTDFTQAVAHLPKNARLYRYDRCTDTASRGLPASLWKAIRKAIRKNHIRLMNFQNPILTCICGPEQEP